MEIIREFLPTPTGGTVVIRSNCYASSLDHIDRLYAAACRDWPNVTGADVEVRKFGGDRIRGIFGIEFCVPTSEAPEGYSRLYKLEQVL